MDIELISTDELIEELLKRYDVAVFGGFKWEEYKDNKLDISFKQEESPVYKLIHLMSYTLQKINDDLAPEYPDEEKDKIIEEYWSGIQNIIDSLENRGDVNMELATRPCGLLHEWVKLSLFYK